MHVILSRKAWKLWKLCSVLSVRGKTSPLSRGIKKRLNEKQQSRQSSSEINVKSEDKQEITQENTAIFVFQVHLVLLCLHCLCFSQLIWTTFCCQDILRESRPCSWKRSQNHLELELTSPWKRVNGTLRDAHWTNRLRPKIWWQRWKLRLAWAWRCTDVRRVRSWSPTVALKSTILKCLDQDVFEDCLKWFKMIGNLMCLNRSNADAEWLRRKEALRSIAHQYLKWGQNRWGRSGVLWKHRVFWVLLFLLFYILYFLITWWFICFKKYVDMLHYCRTWRRWPRVTWRQWPPERHSQDIDPAVRISWCFVQHSVWKAPRHRDCQRDETE